MPGKQVSVIWPGKFPLCHLNTEGEAVLESFVPVERRLRCRAWNLQLPGNHLVAPRPWPGRTQGGFLFFRKYCSWGKPHFSVVVWFEDDESTGNALVKTGRTGSQRWMPSLRGFISFTRETRNELNDFWFPWLDGRKTFMCLAYEVLCFELLLDLDG